MKKDILISGLLGGAVLFISMLIFHAILPFKSSIILNTVSDQYGLQKALTAEITEPGIYANPYLPPHESSSVPDYLNQPIYQIIYKGNTHSTVPGLFSFPVLMIFIAPVIAAWLLSVTSERILSKYSRRVLFIAVLGLFIAVFCDILQMSTGLLTNEYYLFSAVSNTITWILAGLVIAWKIKPKGI